MAAQRIALTRVGVLARDLLAGLPPHDHGRGPSDARLLVAAVFDRSFYLARATRFACIGTASIGNGPLNAICNLVEPLDWEEMGVVEGAAVSVDPEAIRIADGPDIATAGATTWQQPAWPASPDRVALRASLAGMRTLAEGFPVRGGLAGLILGSAGEDALSRAVACAASLHLATLRDWLDAQLAGDGGDVASAGRGAVKGLLGLGAGLTPAGDDMLAGMLIGLHCSGHVASAAALAGLIRAAPAGATSALSAAHLGAAMAGFAGEAVHAAATALLTGEPAAMRRALARLDQLGQTSGWDILAGLAAALAAVADRP